MLLLFPMQVSPSQIPAQRLVVEFQTEIGQQDASQEKARGYRPALGKGEPHPSPAPQPSVEQVHEGVMHHVHRIRHIAQKLAYPGGA